MVIQITGQTRKYLGPYNLPLYQHVIRSVELETLGMRYFPQDFFRLTL